MLRPASVKGVIRSKENDGNVVFLMHAQARGLNSSPGFSIALRSPELVDRVWDDAVDGAWAPGKAPLPLLSAFLQHVQDEDVEQAEQTAQASEQGASRRSIAASLGTKDWCADAVLAVEPQNRLVQDLVVAMKQQLALGT
jgi:hypothetical protein